MSETGKKIRGERREIWSWVSCEPHLWHSFLALLMKLNLHQKIMNHFCRTPAVFEILEESVGNVLFWALLWRPFRTLIDVRYWTFLTDSWHLKHILFSYQNFFFLLTLLYKGSIDEPHGVVESSRCHWSHL